MAASGVITKSMHEDRKPDWSAEPNAGRGILQVRVLEGAVSEFRWLVPVSLLLPLQDLLSLKLDSMGRQVRLPEVNMADGTSQDLAVTVLGDKEAFGAGKFARNEITVEFHGQGAQKYFAFSGYKMDVSGCVDDNWVPTNVKKSR
uniref:Uncharacterized protein n=1 Tax=Ditylenchus dipsaci TaxID=166011 RepID=A0A915DUL4_9BILA